MRVFYAASDEHLALALVQGDLTTKRYIQYPERVQVLANSYEFQKRGLKA